MGQSLGESLPTLRAQLATMQIDTDGLAARIDDLIDHLERPRDTTVLRVLESKAAAGDTAIAVTSAAMRICGGAAFARHMAIERLFRDVHAGAGMAPTGDVLREFIGRRSGCRRSKRRACRAASSPTTSSFVTDQPGGKP